jgi:hypothetical protein
MRLTLMGMALIALIGLTATSAAAEEAEKTSRFHYETCNCHFGYGDTCQVVAACVSEGGYCSRSCNSPPPSNVTLRVRG